MQTNGLTIPDAGSSRQFIADPEGGWMYIITTSILVEQKRLDEFQGQLAKAEKERDAAQAVVDEIKAQIVVINTPVVATPL